VRGRPWIVPATWMLVLGMTACGADGGSADGADVRDEVDAESESGADGEGDGSSDGEVGRETDDAAEAEAGEPCADPAAWRDCFAARATDPTICGTAGEAELRAAAGRGFEQRAFPVARGGDVWFAWRGDAATVGVAGDFNGWVPEELARLCATDLFVLRRPLAAGFYEYKLVVDGAWTLDPANRGFAFDDYEGNPERKNSVVDLPGSGRGHLEWWPDVASPELGNTRDVFVYLPPDYDPEGAERYPGLYLHDGQNVFDDDSCCFGHGGWEVNLAIDRLAAEGAIEPPIVVGVANTSDRMSEYTQCAEFSGTGDAYGRFLVETLLPRIEAYYRIDPARRALAGSSLGGNISFVVAQAHPAAFRGGLGSMSGAFWVCAAEGSSVPQAIRGSGFPLAPPLPIYLDHGGFVADNSDGAADTVAVRDALLARGWTLGSDLFYVHEEGAEHDEAAWRRRVPGLLEALFPP